MASEESTVVVASDWESSACCECGRLKPAKRVEAGKRYCDTCYARCFKRLMCSGCGMFKTLLASNPQAKCRQCVAGAPCIRCAMSGRPLGMLREEGPVCNSCYPYFKKREPCELCGEPAHMGSHIETESGRKRVCHRCERADHRTCALCKRHRRCSARDDGTWACKKCLEVGVVPCVMCANPMPAGYGVRCMACYRRARCEAEALQLGELLSSPRVRAAFAEYSAWAMAEIDHFRLVQALPRHIEFFLALEAHGDEPWNEGLLLRTFNASGLSSYRLPVRWLRDIGLAEISPEAKVANAERGRSIALVESTAPNTLARQLMKAFFDELDAKAKAGLLKPRSIRMALRPALTLLLTADPQGQRMPEQASLDKLLEDAPGQRSAVSTFLGFVKAKHGVRLTPKDSSGKPNTARRRRLGEQLAALAKEPQRSAEFDQRWKLLALAYFHKMPQARAKVLLKDGDLERRDGGYELTVEKDVFWIPEPPAIRADTVNLPRAA